MEWPAPQRARMEKILLNSAKPSFRNKADVHSPQDEHIEGFILVGPVLRYLRQPCIQKQEDITQHKCVQCP